MYVFIQECVCVIYVSKTVYIMCANIIPCIFFFFNVGCIQICKVGVHKFLFLTFVLFSAYDKIKSLAILHVIAVWKQRCIQRLGSLKDEAEVNQENSGHPGNKNTRD